MRSLQPNTYADLRTGQAGALSPRGVYADLKSGKSGVWFVRLPFCSCCHTRDIAQSETKLNRAEAYAIRVEKMLGHNERCARTGERSYPLPQYRRAA